MGDAGLSPLGCFLSIAAVATDFADGANLKCSAYPQESAFGVFEHWRGIVRKRFRIRICVCLARATPLSRRSVPRARPCSCLRLPCAFRAERRTGCYAPPMEIGGSVDCSEMDDGMAMSMAAEGSSDQKPCERMTLGCLVAMGCVAPMAVPDAAPVKLAVSLFPRAPFLAGSSAGLHSRPLPPESPPPQADRIV